jgi:hypothetical protein
MPFDVEFALIYGLKSKTKIRYKDLSYRKNLVEWMRILNSLYPPDHLTITHQPHANLVTPKGDFSLGLSAIGNRKRKPFPQFKTGNNNFIRVKKIYNVFSAKPCAKNNKVVSSFLINTKIIRFNNLKIRQNAIPFPKQTFACTRRIFMLCFHFYFLSFSFLLSSSNHQIIKFFPILPFSIFQIL